MGMLATTTQTEIENTTYTEAKLRLANDNAKTSARGAWSESKLGISFTKAAASQFVRAVDGFVNQPAEKGRRHNRAAEYLRATGIEPATIAFLFTKALYNMLALTHRRRAKRVSLSIKAADLIHDEWRIRVFNDSKKRKALLKKLFKQFDKRTYPRDWRKKTIINYFHAEQAEWAAWSTKEKLVIGYSLLVLFRDATGLVEAPSSSQYVDPSPALVKAVEEALESRVLDYMIYKPMVVPPLPWGEDYLFRGGYLSSKIRRYPIIKGSKRRDVGRMLAMDWSQIIPAINALQETPWRVNQKVLDVLDWCMYDQGGGMAGLPKADAKPLPPEPEGYRTDEEVRKAHNKVCFLIHNANREIISKRLMVLHTLVVAKQFRNFKAIYFPHNLDTRGRAYPLPAFLQPQGPDYTKALLEFSNGKPIENEEQACWLAIAGANAYGIDKVPLQDRVNWVQDNEDLIFSIAADPKSDLRWTEASEPFQFLRFCLEWAAFWDNGYGYVSHMVVPVDATCSGLQHYSAMLRDEVGGRSVNLVPGLSRQDIYQDVADVVIGQLLTDGSSMAQDWLAFGIDRKTTKRQVMVVPYAGTFASCMEYTRASVEEKMKDGHPANWTSEDPSHTERVVYLSKLIWAAIDQVVIKGKEAMRWLSKTASEYTKLVNTREGTAYEKRMSWVTPDGFEAVHYRIEEKKKQVKSYLDGRVDLTYYDETPNLDPKGMALAVAPNFVHSMDACLLRMAVMKGLGEGITDFAMIHDSFGVHAHDMARFLSSCIKPAFVEMYQTDPLQEFAARLPLENLELDPLPSKGELALEDVVNSEFFFS